MPQNNIMKNDSKQKEEQILSDLTGWCIERSEKLNDDDSYALLKEFEEWIDYEAEIVDVADITTINNS